MSIHSTRERGAVLVHVAIAIIGLTAMTALAFDFGVKWVGRAQAQDSADAGALAGAIALSFDNQLDRSNTGPGKQSAWQYASANTIWGQAPNVDITNDINILCPAGSPGAPACTGLCPAPYEAATCVKVDVYRNQLRGNPLPTFFANLVNVGNQGVRATATAMVMAGNASDCLKPWAVPDKWVERYPVAGPWLPTSRFNKYYDQGNQTGAPLPNPDLYVAPTATDPGTGFTLATDYGTELLLKSGNPQQATSPGWFYPVQLTEPGGDEYRENIAGCAGVVWGIGDMLPVEPGNMIGPTAQGVRDLIAQDPNARWNPNTRRVEGSCAGTSACPNMSHSPRIVAIPIFDTAAYEDGRQSGRITIRIVNILGFFIEDLVGNDVRGVLVNTPAIVSGGNGTINSQSAFAVTIVLVR
jgi:hypothetical protein